MQASQTTTTTTTTKQTNTAEVPRSACKIYVSLGRHLDHFSADLALRATNSFKTD